MKLFSILLLLCLNGCAVIATTIGSSPATISAAQTLDAVKLGVDAVSAGATDKTTTDHAVSTVSGLDCKATNIIKGKVYCEDRH
jgi:uncharacterized protein YceK